MIKHSINHGELTISIYKPYQYFAMVHGIPFLVHVFPKAPAESNDNKGQPRARKTHVDVVSVFCLLLLKG